MSNEASPEPGELAERQLAGYLGVGTHPVPESLNAGFSMYIAAWPLLECYPGNRFQTGLFGTWMHQQFDEPKPDRKLYCDIEGGLGWWRDTRFATETPKFIMGGVALNFSAWANGPGAGKTRDWNEPCGTYGVAQLSPHVLWPPDGLNVKRGTCGELWGYGYLPLPLIDAKATTAGKDVPTGDNTWTLFLNTASFKGPVAFFTPYFFSEPSIDDPDVAGLFLDTRPVSPNRHLQMETQYVPGMQAADASGQVYARIAPTSFPRDARGASTVVHKSTVYDRSALWDAVNPWLNGDAGPVDSAFAPDGSVVQNMKGENRSSWAIWPDGTPRDERIRLDWSAIARATVFDPHTFGYRWNEDCVERTEGADGPLFTLPEYYRLNEAGETPLWEPVSADAIPSETGLHTVDFAPPETASEGPYETPDDPASCWKTPGPVAGPFTARPGDGRTVIYYWYRFADQPALLNADLADAEREALQLRVEKLHREWRPDGEYMAPPDMGELAEIDPALLVTAPEGLEIGYVPIVTWQGIED